MPSRPVSSTPRPRVSISEKIGRIVQEIDGRGNASLTRLTVLKKWLEPAGRLPALGGWIARRAAFDNAGKEPGEKALLAKARAFFEGVPADANSWSARDRRSAEALHQQAWNYKREFRGQQWGPVRVVHSWPLYLIEGGLALVLESNPHSSDGYKLAADWAQNFDGRYGSGFNGPSRERLVELAKWTEEIE